MKQLSGRRAREWSALTLLVGSMLTMFLAMAVPVGAEAPAFEPAAGVSVMVDGRPIGTGSSKIESCSVDVAISGLTATTSVGVMISAVPPSVPEGTETVLVDDESSAEPPAWSKAYPLESLVGDLERHPNGYRVAVAVSLEGVVVGEHEYWLGCGEPQTGNPTRVQFVAEWQGLEGALVDDQLDWVLPDGWRDDFVISASSDKGTASCTYPEGSDVLVCEYTNPGHGGEKPGLVVPGNPRAEYTVTVEGVPAGWLVDPDTVGTFIGRETCPRGGDHGDGDDHGHESGLGVSEHDDEGGGREPCFHTVVFREQPAPPPPPPPPGPSLVDDTSVLPAAQTPGLLGGATGSAPASVQPTAQALPATGGTDQLLAVVGVVLVLAGSAIVWATRSRGAPAGSRPS